VAFGFLWAITLLTYLLPPAEIWSRPAAAAAHAQPGALHRHRHCGVHAGVRFARHLFCRFGCAVGLFQSLAWMANPKALVMAFDRAGAADCRTAAPPAPAGAPATAPARCA
jgi:hypothetical protein